MDCKEIDENDNTTTIIMGIFIAKAFLKLHVYSFRIRFTRKYGN